MSYYKDLREYIDILKKKEKLVHFKRPVIKETQLGPLYWLQFRGLPEEQWKSFLFDNVIDIKGKEYGRVLMGPYGTSREILSIGLGCQVQDINEKWCQACLHPIKPEIVSEAPVQEVIMEGSELDNIGLGMLAAPVEHPGFSGVIRTTTQYITKDPETGHINVGAYGGHISTRKTMRMGISPQHHGRIHWLKAKEKGKPLPVAIIIGTTPNVVLTSVAPVAYGVNELDIAGALAGEPVKLVKAKTVDLEVPANAEIVIEGFASTEYLEPGTSVGDYPGYMSDTEGWFRPVINITCITYRKNPIFVTTTVGYPPNDTSLLSAVGREVGLYKHLKYDCYIPGVLDISLPESGGGCNICVIQIKKTALWEPWQVLNALAGYHPGLAKIAIVVDEDINPRDPDAVNWALSFAMQPHRDVRIITHRTPTLDPSACPPGTSHEERSFPLPAGVSAMLIDATRKWPYPPVGLPKQEFMEQAMKIWQEEGLPQLHLKKPWYGYHLGRWRMEDIENAELILKGEHFKLGEKLASRRIKIT